MPTLSYYTYMFTVFCRVHEMWEAKLRDIEAATSSIYLEQYILENLGSDEIGEMFMLALIKKAKEGVKVRLILDFQGSFELFKDTKYNDLLTSAGGSVFYYKTLGWSRIFSPSKLILRDHRKLLIVDRKVAWIGGAVIGERFRDWDDFMVRFNDNAVADTMHQEFEEQYDRLQDKVPLLAPMKAINEHTHLVGNGPGIGNRFCYDEICHAILLAKKRVILITPYFAPPLKLLRIIKRRLAEGLEITLLIPRHTDNHLADIVREAYLPKLLKRGLSLEYYESMNHGKLVIVDDSWLTFGSTNLDVLSLSLNHELNITTTDTELMGKVLKTVEYWRTGLTQVKNGQCEYRKLSMRDKIVGKTVSFIVRHVL